MKVSKNEFGDIVITLQHQEEIDCLHELFGSVAGSGYGRKLTDLLFDEIRKFSTFDSLSGSSRHFHGDLHAIKD